MKSVISLDKESIVGTRECAGGSGFGGGCLRRTDTQYHASIKPHTNNSIYHHRTPQNHSTRYDHGTPYNYNTGFNA